jgi:hypothetical protein
MTDDATDTDEGGLPERLDYDARLAALADGVLLGQRCRECGAVSATPRRVCMECHAEDPETVELPTDGVVHSETSIEVTPEGFDDGYRVGIVDLGEARVLARLGGDAGIGTEVSLSGVVSDAAGSAPVFE